MIIEEYRNTTRVEIDNTNAEIPIFDLSTGDVNGRIIRFAFYDGNTAVDPAGLSCQFVIDQHGGVYEDMDAVSGEDTATWEVAPATHGLDPGIFNAAFRVAASDGSITETIPFKIRIVKGILEEGEEGTEMQSVLSEFETRVGEATTEVTGAISRANELIEQLEDVDVESATTAANGAAERAEAAAAALEDLAKLGLSVVSGAINVTYLVETED